MVIYGRTHIAAVVRGLAPSGPDVVVAHESVGRAHLDQAQVGQAEAGGDDLGHLGVDALPDLDATVGDVDSGVMLVDGDLMIYKMHRVPHLAG